MLQAGYSSPSLQRPAAAHRGVDLFGKSLRKRRRFRWTTNSQGTIIKGVIRVRGLVSRSTCGNRGPAGMDWPGARKNVLSTSAQKSAGSAQILDAGRFGTGASRGGAAWHGAERSSERYSSQLPAAQSPGRGPVRIALGATPS